MARACDIPGYKTNQCIGWIFRWLNDARNGPWIMIIDNANQSNDMPWINDIAEFESRLPRCSHGTIVFTTEGKSMASKLLKGNESGILLNVGSLSITVSVELLKKHFDGRVDQYSESCLELISDWLGGMPLSITQAAATANIDKTTFGVIWKRLKVIASTGAGWSNQEMRFYLFCRSASDLRWQTCVGRAQRRSPFALDLFFLMSFFGTNSIPETPLLAYLFYRDSSDAQNQQKSTLENIQELFSFPKRLWGPTERARDTTQGFLSFEHRFANRGQTWDALYKPQLEEALAALNDFCCLHNDHDGSFRMYLQVQLSVQEKLQDPRNLEALPHLEHAVMCVSAILLDVAEGISMLDQTDCGNLYHHFRSLEKNVVELIPKSCDAKLACASFRYKYGLYCLSYGLKKCCQSWDQVEDMFRTSAEIYQEVLGERHPRTLKARHQAELTQIERQKDIGARAELDKIRDLVCDQPNAFPAALCDDMMWGDRIMLNITYRHYENWVIAAREFAMALRELGRLHAHDSDQVLRILQRMVVFYRLWMQSGEINGWTNVRDVFRAIDTSDILSKNDSFKAPCDAPSIKVLWQFSKNVYCIQPGNTAVIDMPREPVSSVLLEWKRLAQDVFDRYKHRHGEDHPDTLRNLTELTIAESYQAFGVAASRPLEMAEDCHRLQVNILGESHRDTPGTKRLVGEILHKAGRSAEAVQVLRECYDSLVHNFKGTSNLTLECAFSLAETYLSVGRFGRPKDADDLMEQMIKVREVEFKAKNDWKPHGLCFALELSAILQRRQGRFGEAMEILERILELCKYADPSYPPQHDKPFEYEVKIRYSIAFCYFQDGNWEEEEKRGLTVLEQRRNWEVGRIFYGKNHVDTLRSLFLVALARWNLGWCDEARSMMRECWVGAKGRSGVEHKLSRQALSQLVEYMKRVLRRMKKLGRS